MTSLTILLATPPAAAVGPIPRLTQLLATELEALGCRVETADWGSDPSQTSAAGRALGRLKDMLGVWRRARDCDVTVVASAHYGNTLARDIPLLFGLRVARRPVVLHFHGSQPEVLLGPGRPLFKVASRMLVSAATGVLVLSSEERATWERFRPKTQVRVVKNPFVGLSRPAGRPGGTAESGAEGGAPAPVGTPLVLFVGRMLEIKGVYDLVEAARLLAAAHPGLHFQVVMAGDGPEVGGIHRAAEKAGVAERFAFTGHLATDDLAALYRKATVFVLPSHLEGFPTVIPEAMDAGLPIVTTAIRGAVDYLEEGANALLVPPRDPARLAEALATLLADAEMRSRMSENNRRKVSIFAPRRVAAEYLAVLGEIAGGRGGRS